jgi:hypothetical protein
VIGIGSSICHPEASRLARIASGGRHGLAQSVFQVGGNAGAALRLSTDAAGIDFVFRLSAFLPAIGLLAFFLARIAPRGRA